MSENVKQIKTAFERQAKALSIRPTIGQGTAVTKARVRDGLTCDIEDGRWRLTADMSEKHGGGGAGPDPGVFGRAALASCLAMSYVRWAAKLDIPLNNVEVEVQADYDARGEMGVAEVSPGYSEVRYLVTIDSPASEADITRLLDTADAHTPYFDIFSKPQKMRREVKMLATEE